MVLRNGYSSSPCTPPMRPSATPFTSPSEPPGCTSEYGSIVANLRHHRHHDVVRSHPSQGVAVLVATRPETLIDFIQHPLHRGQLDPHQANQCHRIVLQEEPSMRMVRHHRVM